MILTNLLLTNAIVFVSTIVITLLIKETCGKISDIFAVIVGIIMVYLAVSSPIYFILLVWL